MRWTSPARRGWRDGAGTMRRQGGSSVGPRSHVRVRLLRGAASRVSGQGGVAGVGACAGVWHATTGAACSAHAGRCDSLGLVGCTARSGGVWPAPRYAGLLCRRMRMACICRVAGTQHMLVAACASMSTCTCAWPSWKSEDDASRTCEASMQRHHACCKHMMPAWWRRAWLGVVATSRASRCNHSDTRPALADSTHILCSCSSPQAASRGRCLFGSARASGWHIAARQHTPRPGPAPGPEGAAACIGTATFPNSTRSLSPLNGACSPAVGVNELFTPSHTITGPHAARLIRPLEG